jgi:selenocysteine-specific elongation factor
VAQCEEIVGGQVLNALLEQGRLVRLSDDVIFLVETYEQMRDRIVAFLHDNPTITVAQVRDLFGASRKYALALVNYLDEKRITRRIGDERVLR